MLTLTDKVFKAAVGMNPTLVMFHAAFSGPCKLAMPEFKAAAARAGNRVKFATFDLDGNPDTPERYGVRGIPEFIYFVDGAPKSATVGALNCEQILGLIDD